MRVLAIGATGQFAGLVVPALAARGVRVRALVYDPAKQDRVREAGADQAVAGDLRDPASLRAALDGVDGVFLVIPAYAPDTAALGTGVVATAQAAGVRAGRVIRRVPPVAVVGEPREHAASRRGALPLGSRVHRPAARDVHAGPVRRLAVGG